MSTKGKSRQAGTLAASNGNRKTTNISSLYNETNGGVKPHFLALFQQAQRFAANARSSWRGAIRRRDTGDARRLFALALRHQQIADHLAGLLADWSK